MKINIFVTFAAITALFGLAGCKPKETTLTGQVFIVTQGADNVKLGDVEILLIDKKQVGVFLENKLPAIKSGIESRQKEYDASLKDKFLQSSNTLYEFNLYFLNNNDEYRLIKDKLVQIPIHISSLQSQIKGLKESSSFSPASGESYLYLQRQIKEYEIAIDNWTDESSRLNARMDEIKMNANAERTILEQKLAEARSMFGTKINDYPAGEDYFADFSPRIIQKKLTDADGRFSFSYPRNTFLTIYAKAERMVGTKTEKYYWLVDSPNNVDSAQIFLSNKNLVFVDPDGYFKIKPVDVTRESKLSHP